MAESRGLLPQESPSAYHSLKVPSVSEYLPSKHGECNQDVHTFCKSPDSSSRLRNEMTMVNTELHTALSLVDTDDQRRKQANPR
jgi:hypothetical protein